MLTSTVARGKEQRRARRYSVNFRCDVNPAGQSNETISSHTRDISSSGLYLSLPAKLEIGARVELLLHFPLEAAGGKRVAVRCQGTVARIEEQDDQRFGVGAVIEQFEFLQLDSSAATKAS